MQGLKSSFSQPLIAAVTDDLLGMEKKFPGRCFAMMGLHPCSVKEDFKTELQLVNEYINKRSFAAAWRNRS
jgi:TatD DNase family protein